MFYTEEIGKIVENEFQEISSRRPLTLKYGPLSNIFTYIGKCLENNEPEKARALFCQQWAKISHFSKEALLDTDIISYAKKYYEMISAIISRAYYDCLLGKHRLNTYYEFAVADEHLEFMLYSLSEYFRERFDDIEMRGKKLSLEAEDNGIPSPFRPQYNASENKKVFLDTLKKMSVSIGVEIDNERKFISVSFDEFWNKQTNTFEFDSVDDLLSYVYNYKESNRLWDNQELENNQTKVRKQR